MGLKERFANRPTHELGGTGKSFIDADTLTDGKQNYRIQGINAGEVEKFVADEGYKLGTAGGEETTNIIHALANEQGYTNVVPLLNPDGTPQYDTGGKRQLVDLVNEDGKSFKTSLLQAGAFDINKYTTKEDIAASQIAKARRDRDIREGTYEESAFDKAARGINEAERIEGEKQQGFKISALNEAQRAEYIAAGYGHVLADNVQIRSHDRTLDNKSLNPWSDSWDQGLIGVGEAAFGVANLLGEKTGAEGLANWGEDGVERQRAKLAEFGTTILDYKDVKGFGDAIEYLGNNLALSIPYMAITAGATVAAPFTGGLSLSAPASIYTGQVWNEMEGEKSAGYAIAAGVTQAALDRLGLTFILPKGVASKEVFNKAIEGMVKKGWTKEAAEQSLAAATRREIAGLAGDVQEIAKSQLKAKEIAKGLLTKAGVGGVSEGLTEAGQELIGYTAAVQGSDKAFDWHDLNNRLVSAAIAGGSLGAGLSVPSSAYNAGAWIDVAHRTSTETEASASQAEIWAQEEQEKHGRIRSNEEIAADARARFTEQPGSTVEERSLDYKDAQAGKSSIDRLGEAALDSPDLWRGAVRSAIPLEVQQQAPAGRELANILGGNLQRTFHGETFESAKHHRVSIMKNMIKEPRAFFKSFGAKSRKARADVSDNLYSQYQAAFNKDGDFDANLLPQDLKNRGEVIEFAKELQVLGDKMYADQKKHNPELGYVKNYLMKYKTFDKHSIYKNQKEFANLLMQEYKLSHADAKKITDELVDNSEINDIDEAFSVVKGGISPQSHKKRSLGLSENQNFNKFMERDIFQNVSRAVKSAARYTAHRDYIGENGAVISKLLDDMQNQGIPKATVDKVAHKIKKYLDAESGNLGRAQTDLGKKVQRLQKNLMMATTLASLPLAVVSSLVEAALSMQALRKDQIFGKDGSLQSFGQVLGSKIWKGMEKNIRQRDYQGRTPQEIVRDLGFYDWDVGAATTTGVTEVNSWQQPVYEEFFKWNGLQSWTNYTRAVRASIAGDYMFDKAQTIGEHRLSGEPRTREVQEAEEALRNLGIDVDSFVEQAQTRVAGIPLDPDAEQEFGNAMREATYNFINNAVALPGAANRPLIFQDPRFALFTQFQGFIATFTANHIPKLWGEYVKRGTPAMKYNAFAVMTTMVMLGFASQYLKDLIKYGPDDEGDETGLNPYLEKPEYIQRGIRASGLLGTGERVLDLAFPIYEERSKGVGDWAWNLVSGESPGISYAERIAKATGKLAEGDTTGAAYNTLKSTPLVGPFTATNKGIANLITTGSWQPRGE